MSRQLPRLKILLTEGSSTSARQTLYALGGRHTIDILDANRFGQCRFSQFVRKWYRCPPFSQDPRGYLAVLLQRLTSEKYDVLFPTHEQVFLLARVRERLSRHVSVPVPGFESLDQVIGKVPFVRLLERLNLPQPATKIVCGREALLQAAKWPCFIKASQSTAGEGVRLIRRAEELEVAATEFSQRGWLNDHTELLVQQPATGAKGAVAGVFQHGQLVGAYCTEATSLGVGGSSASRILVDNPVAVEDMRRLGSHLAWHGAMVMEYFRDVQSGAMQYIECNPRIGETINATLAGANLCEQMLRIATGEQIEPMPVPPGGLRTHQGFIARLGVAVQTGSRRAVLGELVRQWLGRDIYAGSQNEMTRPREDFLSLIPAIAVTLRLLVAPRSAQRLITSTVDNYCLSESAARRIREMSDEP